MSIVNDLERARAAVERRNWPLAYELLRQADDLGAEDTMALATSAYMTGDLNAAVRALQRGYQERIRDHDPLGAVHFASWLGVVLNVQGEHAVGAGWVARAQRLLESEPEDIVERGQMLVPRVPPPAQPRRSTRRRRARGPDGRDGPAVPATPI